MLYSFWRSQKGYTFVEVLIVVVVLGILVAVGVPVFSSSYTAQAKKDCNNQRVVVQSLVQEVMTGMVDNGRAQKSIRFEAGHIKEGFDQKVITYGGDGVTGNGDDSYVGKKCFILLDGDAAFTIGDIRGGYRPEGFSADLDGYDDGCNKGYFLKKQRLAEDKFFWYLTNEEIPVCPFADYENIAVTDDYRYYIFEDGTVLCDCPKCNEIED